MSSVEGNENIEEVFNQILKEEYKQEWQLIAFPPKLVAFFCYALPALLMLSSGDYHTQNVLVLLFLSAIIGTGLYMHYRYHSVIKAFFSNDKPLNQIVREVQVRAKNNPPSSPLTQVEESDWNLIISKFEKSMEAEDEDSDTMNLSTLFDRTEQTTLPPKRASWLSRFFGRK